MELYHGPTKLTLYHGDCREVLHVIPDQSIDLVLTDPPYGGIHDVEWDKTDPFTVELLQEIRRVCKPHASVYVWCGIGEKSRSLIDFIPRLDQVFTFKDLITWKKRRGIGMRRGWLYTREEILWYVVDNKQFVWNKDEQYGGEDNQFSHGFGGHKCLSDKKRITNVWTDVPEKLGKKDIPHLTPKPLDALKRIIKLHTAEGNVVLDPFMGSGSTGLAARLLGRDFVGIELEKEYYDYCVSVLS